MSKDIETRKKNIHIFAAYAFSYIHPCDTMFKERIEEIVAELQALLIYMPKYKVILKTQGVDDDNDLIVEEKEMTVYATKHLEYLLILIRDHKTTSEIDITQLYDICENYCKLLFYYYREKYHINLENLPEIYSSRKIDDTFVYKGDIVLPQQFTDYISCFTCKTENRKDPHCTFGYKCPSAAGGK